MKRVLSLGSLSSKKRGASSSEQKEVNHPLINIDFKDITFVVDTKDGKLEILKGISGRAEAGKVLAIMGSSGAGKSTLLDVLSANTISGEVSGSILVNGYRLSPADRKKISCYVTQRDILLASSTVREAITTAALLKLPYHMPKQDKLARVDEVIKELGLTGCQHTLVGDETLNMKGISGGQRRRLSVGIELIKDPPCLYCDEPTSGLDSESAAGMMTILKSLAENSMRTVIVTIHQPNSQITAGFQDFLLLAGGRVVYTGQWSDAVTTFADRGYQCPPYMNPTDYFLSVLADDGTATKLADVEQERLLMSSSAADGGGGGGGDGGVEVVVDMGEQIISNNKSSNGGINTTTNTYTTAEQLTTSLTTLTGSQQLRGLAKASSKAGAPFLYQVWVLSHRMLKMWIRNPIMLISEASQYIFMALFVGLMYLQLNNSVETGVSDRAASMWFAMAVLSFTPSYTAATLWDKDRVLVRKEAGQGMYSVHSWFWAKTATTVPMEIIQTTLFVVISFFMVGYALTVSNFFVFLAAYIMFQITSESIGLMCGMATSSATYAILVLTFVLLFLLSFSGFLVSDVPVYFAWIGKISYLTYAYAAVVIHDFNETTFVTSNGEVIPGSELIPAQINNGLSVGVNLLVLLGLMVGTRLFAWLALYLMAKFKKL